MKKNFYLLTVLFVSALFAFTSCSEEDDNGGGRGLTSNVISGTIENFPTDGRYIFEAYCDDEVIATTEIASNGKFTITLPPELPKDMLYTLESASTINIRDESVLISGSINFGIRKENESGSSYRSLIYGYINQEVVKIINSLHLFTVMEILKFLGKHLIIHWMLKFR